ncbi:MAG: V4R domain-containing protein [Nitrososphaeria archaeon]
MADLSPSPGPGAPEILLPLSWIEPGRRLGVVSAVLGSERALASLVEALEGELEVIGSIRNKRGGAILWEAIVDLGDADPKDLGSRLGSIEGVGSVEVREGLVPGFASLHGGILRIAGTRSIVTTSYILLGMLLGMREFLGEEMGETALYYIGYYSGRDAARAIGGILGAGAIPRASFAVLQAHGYASSLEALRSPDGSRYRIEARDLVECDLLKGRMRGRTSHWFRGMLAGILEASEGGEWEVEEVECVNDGSDKCAFEARRRAPGSNPPRPTTR